MSAFHPPAVRPTYAQYIFGARRPTSDHLPATNHPSPSPAMPNPNAPPTPGSSSDIRGQESVHVAPVFNLPPTAFADPDRASTTSTTPSVNGSDSSYRPVSPTSPTAVSRKRPVSKAGLAKDEFPLPPPPTRARKIIQMKPKEKEQKSVQEPAITVPQPPTTPKAGGRKKQGNNGTTAAGRKIARKTAHSLIERRRRSKMNEEFGVLKDMVPACRGQEMHKLAILQVRRSNPISGVLLTNYRPASSIFVIWSNAWQISRPNTDPHGHHQCRYPIHQRMRTKMKTTTMMMTTTTRWRMKGKNPPNPLLYLHHRALTPTPTPVGTAPAFPSPHSPKSPHPR
jgi:hypothetical protein